MSAKNEKLAKIEFKKISKTKIKIIRLKEVRNGVSYYFIEDEFGEEYVVDVKND